VVEALLERGALHAPGEVDAVELEHVEAGRAQRLALGEQDERAGDVAAQVVEVRGHRVGAAAEVDGVREPDDLGVGTWQSFSLVVFFGVLIKRPPKFVKRPPNFSLMFT